MKVEPVNYMHGGMSLELIAETEVEYALLKRAWKHGHMETGNGRTRIRDGSFGFFIEVFPQDPVDNT